MITVITTPARCAHNPTCVGFVVQAAGNSVSNEVASPCIIEKQVTADVIFTNTDAASSSVPKCPMEITLASDSEYSANWVKKTGIVDLTNNPSSVRTVLCQE